MPPSERYPDVPYQPQLIDVTYAGLVGGAASDAPLVIPALNRDGDCLSELVLALFGSIAGAESVLLSFDEDYRTRVVMTEAPHGTAPALEGKNIANPMAMILAVAALLRYLGDARRRGRRRVGVRAVYEAVLEATARRHPHSGPRRPRHDVGAHRRGDRARAHEARDLVEPRAASGRLTSAHRAAVCTPAAWSWRSRRPATGSAAPPLVLAHGLTATRRYVVHGSRLLERSGYRVVSYDARGHGESEPGARARRVRVRGPGRGPRAVLDELGLERVVLVGASMGAATTLAFALAHPERVARAGADHARPTSGCRRPTRASWRAGTRWRTGSSATAWRVSCASTASRRWSRGSEGWSWRRSDSGSSATGTRRRWRTRCAWCRARQPSNGVVALERVAVADAGGGAAATSWTPSTRYRGRRRSTRSASRAPSWSSRSRAPRPLAWRGAQLSRAIIGFLERAGVGPSLSGTRIGARFGPPCNPPCRTRVLSEPVPSLTNLCSGQPKQTSEISGSPAAPREGRGPVSERLREQLQERLMVALDFATLGAYELTAPEGDAALAQIDRPADAPASPAAEAPRHGCASPRPAQARICCSRRRRRSAPSTMAGAAALRSRRRDVAARQAAAPRAQARRDGARGASSPVPGAAA